MASEEPAEGSPAAGCRASEEGSAARPSGRNIMRDVTVKDKNDAYDLLLSVIMMVMMMVKYIPYSDGYYDGYYE